MDVVARKDRTRSAALSARAAMTERDRLAAGSALMAHGLDQWRGLTRLAAYLSVGTEPPTRQLLDALVVGGTQIVVPVIAGETLDWVAYQPGGAVIAGALGVDEPVGERLGVTGLLASEVVLVPALAVDREGNRLGRGRGFYDRALVAVQAPVVAVVYDDELVGSVPIASHDRPVQAVLRPSGYSPL